MDTYTQASQRASQVITESYSNSFSLAIRSLPKAMRLHTYNIYGLVRLGDEIVDSYRRDDARQLLDDLEAEVYIALKRGYSVNPIVHAFQTTANKYNISREFIGPYFASMRMDTGQHTFTRKEYETYIYGSAEVIGLMCLHVFCEGDNSLYDQLAPGAQRLGAAFQKINFLRDLGADHTVLARSYFPGITPEYFDEATKQAIAYEIREDLAAALPLIHQLPKPVRPAILTTYRYYAKLLGKIERTPADTLKQNRIHINDIHKLAILLATYIQVRTRKL